LRTRILGAFDGLPPQQKQLAGYCLDHPQEVPFLGIPDLARRSGVSEATVVRFAQRLGYTGFAELRSALLETVRQRVARPGGRPALPEALSHAPDEDMLAAVARQEVANIRETVERLDRGDFRGAAKAIYRADHVYSFGLGVSSHLSGLLTYLLTQIGVRSTRLSTGFSSGLEQLVVLRPTDVLVVVSFPPYSRQTIEMLRQTADRGIPTVAICDRAGSPVGTIAAHVLPVRTDNMMFTNSFAAASVLLNALTTEIALLDRDQSAQAVSWISQVLEGDEGVIE
jgi:DNA-binding MurR/RpiR family transcriptional regulator